MVPEKPHTLSTPEEVTGNSNGKGVPKAKIFKRKVEAELEI